VTLRGGWPWDFYKAKRQQLQLESIIHPENTWRYKELIFGVNLFFFGGISREYFVCSATVLTETKISAEDDSSESYCNSKV
jgi:hypothetical protein